MSNIKSIKFKKLVQTYRQLNDVRAEIAQSMAKFDWKNRIAEFDALFEEMGSGIKRNA